MKACAENSAYLQGVLSYDGDKYCRIRIGDEEDEIKAVYIYQREGRCGKVPTITRRQLAMLRRLK